MCRDGGHGHSGSLGSWEYFVARERLALLNVLAAVLLWLTGGNKTEERATNRLTASASGLLKSLRLLLPQEREGQRDGGGHCIVQGTNRAVSTAYVTTRLTLLKKTTQLRSLSWKASLLRRPRPCRSRELCRPRRC